MESHTVSIIVIGFTDLQGCWRNAVVPDSDTFVCRASGNQVFLDAGVHTFDLSRMERAYKIFILGVIQRLFNIDANLHKLVVFSSKDNAIISTRQCHAFDFRLHNTRHQLWVFSFDILLDVTLRQLGYLGVRVLVFFRPLIDHDRAVIACDHETFRVSVDAFDVEILQRRLCQVGFVVASAFEQDYFTLIRAD